MHGRAREIGGFMEFCSERGRGTNLILTVMLESEQRKSE